jgi:neutral ceramidase
MYRSLHHALPSIFWTLALLSVASRSALAQEPIQAGAARVTITPDLKTMPCMLGGYVAPERLRKSATGVRDTCFARAMVLSDGRSKVALVSLDLCFLPESFKKAVSERIPDTGIPPDHLFLSATHTHSAPDPLALHDGNTGPAGALTTYNPQLTAWMADRVAEAIKQANARLQPAQIGSGQMQRLGLNRNRRGENLTDDEMTCLKITDRSGSPIAAVFVYAAHPVYYGADMLEVSGDWSGVFARQMEASIPGATVLFLNGAEGDASPNGSDEGTPSDKITTYAAKLSVKANALYQSIPVKPEGTVRGWTQRVELGAPIPHPFFLLAAGSLRATQDQARELVDRLMPTSCSISFLQIGDALLIGLPGEPTAVIGLEAKKMAREKEYKHPAVVALTNGWLGYIVSASQYRAGKYEATMSFYGEKIGEKMLEGVSAGFKR